MSSLGRILSLIIFTGSGVAAAVYVSVSDDLWSRAILEFAQQSPPLASSANDQNDRPVAEGARADNAQPHNLVPGVSLVDSADEHRITALDEAPELDDTAFDNTKSHRIEFDNTESHPTESHRTAGTLPAVAATKPALHSPIQRRPLSESSHPLRGGASQLGDAQPVMAQLRSPIQQQASGSGEATVPVSTLMQLMDKLLVSKSNREPLDVTRTPPPTPQPLPEPAQRSSTQPPELVKPQKQFVNEGDDRLSLQLKDTDIREVLELLSRGSGRNIMATKVVTGTVSATLQGVTFETALRAILKTTGYVARQEGGIIYVGTPEELQSAPPAPEPINTRIYRPNYIRASDLQTLITPLLSPGLGTVSVSEPAENGIAANSTGAGGDNYANSEVVLVRDYESVLIQIDQVFEDVDIRPLQVSIEAMILSVRLDDATRVGVDFELLKDRSDARIISGSPPLSLGQLDFSNGGLKVGFLNGNVSVFLDALETVGDTDVIATPRLLVLNKQRAEILIGAELGYVSSTVTETATTQTVEFLEVGTQLRIRPFISSDGMIRMEVHPELSTGSVRVEGGFTLPDKEVTEVTTNIIAYDGSTVIIGGLIRDDVATAATQIPLLGSLPGIGPLFRQKVEDYNRREILVLITPHIVSDPELSDEGNHAAMESHHRQAVAFEKLSPLGQQRIGHEHFTKARHALAVGNPQLAMKHVNLAIHYNHQHRAAIDLRADIWNGEQLGDHAAGSEYTKPGAEAHPMDGPEIDRWLLDRIDPSEPQSRQFNNPHDATSRVRENATAPRQR
ncbi:MAG: secretin and TonB N-terminal domain-containing protein [Pirellulales bacterium]